MMHLSMMWLGFGAVTAPEVGTVNEGVILARIDNMYEEFLMFIYFPGHCLQRTGRLIIGQSTAGIYACSKISMYSIDFIFII